MQTSYSSYSAINPDFAWSRSTHRARVWRIKPSIVMGSEDVMTKLANIADLERLEGDIEEALISLIDKPADDLIIADLKRRKLHLRDTIELLRHDAVETERSN
jgi:hypothetical protein